jgi:hypothetical protein
MLVQLPSNFFFKLSNLTREWTKQIFLLHCLKTVLELRLIFMVWPVIPVDIFRHRSETYSFENTLMRRITHCSKSPAFPTILTRPEKVILYFCLILKLAQADTVFAFEYPHPVHVLIRFKPILCTVLDLHRLCNKLY